VLKNKKIIVISKYMDVLWILEKFFEYKNLPCKNAYGNTSEVLDSIKEFQDTSSHFIISSSMIDLEFDLSSAEAVVMFDPFCSISSLENCSLGTKSNIDIYRIITKDSTESLVFDFVESNPSKKLYKQDYGVFISEESSFYVFNKLTLTWILQKTANMLFQDNRFEVPAQVALDFDEITLEAENELKSKKTIFTCKKLTPKETQYWNKIIPTSIIQSSVIFPARVGGIKRKREVMEAGLGILQETKKKPVTTNRDQENDSQEEEGYPNEFSDEPMSPPIPEFPHLAMEETEIQTEQEDTRPLKKQRTE